MSIAETVIQKLSALPPEKQEQVLRYVESLDRSPEAPQKHGEPYAWMKIALDARLKGPPDWSGHLDDYLYGDKKNAF